MKSSHALRTFWAFILVLLLTPSTAIRAELSLIECCPQTRPRLAPTAHRIRAELPLVECCAPGDNLCEPVCESQSWFDHGCGSRFRMAEMTIYPTFSYRDKLSATYTEFEFASFTDIGGWEMENRTVLNVADLPSTIKLGAANPGNEPATVNVRANGFGDALSGFFFGRKDTGHNYHLRIGPVWTFPTATDDILGSGQWTVGPGVHYSTEIGRLTTGFFLWQSWGFAVDDSHKRINQMFGKPFIIYELTEKWNLVYIPLGMSHSWGSSEHSWTVPIGGGVRRLFSLGDQRMGLQAQLFDYVSRKKYDPEWEFRMTVEFLFD